MFFASDLKEKYSRRKRYSKPHLFCATVVFHCFCMFFNSCQARVWFFMFFAFVCLRRVCVRGCPPLYRCVAQASKELRLSAVPERTVRAA